MRGVRVLSLFVCIALLSVAATGVVVGYHEGEPHQTNEYEGALIELPADGEDTLSGILDDMADRAGVEGDYTVYVLMSDEFHHFIIYTGEEKFEPTAATIEGYRIDRRGGWTGFIYADSINPSEDRHELSQPEISSRAELYLYENVRVEAEVSQVTYAEDAVDGRFRQPKTRGQIGSRFRRDSQIGSQGAWISFNISDEDHSNTPFIETTYSHWGDGPRFESHYEGFYIEEANVTMEGVVANYSYNYPTLRHRNIYVSSFEVQSQISTLEEVYREPGRYEGRVVRVDADMFGSTIDAKDASVQASACDGSETVGFAPYCAPAATDAQIHTGVATVVDDEGNPLMLPYGGISNHDQARVIEPVAGEYRITAELVPAEEIHTSLEGYALRVYDLDRLGEPATPNQARGAAVGNAEEIEQRIISDLTQDWTGNQETENQYQKHQVGPDRQSEEENKEDEEEILFGTDTYLSQLFFVLVTLVTGSALFIALLYPKAINGLFLNN